MQATIGVLPPVCSILVVLTQLMGDVKIFAMVKNQVIFVLIWRLLGRSVGKENFLWYT